MAVEARRLSCLFPPQLLGNRESMNVIEGNANLYSSPIGYGLLPPLSATTTDTLLPMYGSAITDSIPEKTAMKADSGLTYALPVSRKRQRDSVNQMISFLNVQDQNQIHHNRCGSFAFLGEDVSFQIQQQQFEMDRFVAQHTDRVRLAIEERRKRYSRRIIAAVEEGMMKKLRDKEDEIEKIGKLNWILEEKVKSLCVENQIWRDLAQTNEAAANALRSNLEQVLAQAEDEQTHRRGAELDEAAELKDDAHSCCGSNRCDKEEEVKKKNRRPTGSEEDEEDKSSNNNRNNNNNSDKKDARLCRSCGEKKSCVLLLPCRHLCLCTACGSSLLTCPVCYSTKNATLHVNMSCA